jgi:hypothetical protein
MEEITMRQILVVLVFAIVLLIAAVDAQEPSARRPGADGNRIPDLLQRLLGVSLRPLARRDAVTSFQTGAMYQPSIAVPADVAIVYSSQAERMHSWLQAGYTVHTMYGFRTYTDYAQAHPDEVQRDRYGLPLVIERVSYYMVPAPARIEAAKQYVREALANGSVAIVPEEPEYFARAGYEESFKQEWQRVYGEEWQPPHSSPLARWRSERLKAQMELNIIREMLREAQRVKPDACRMLAIHSPINYANWGIVFPHAAAVAMPELQEIIGQVWTGTARTPCLLDGIRAERTFETAYLEYSSLWHLVRGTGKKVWFLMDPVEDNPNRTMEDYRSNYEQTLIAALMFPDVARYEAMPWPERIFGRVPDPQATQVLSVLSVLQSMSEQKGAKLQAGTSGIATFTADSMMWQRAEPVRSRWENFDGLTYPLLTKGIPVQVLSLDRAHEQGYLNGFKVLLLNYDTMTPPSAQTHRAIKRWVEQGGWLIITGDDSPYAGVADAWWVKAGYKSPLEHLFATLWGATLKREPLGMPPMPSWTTVAREERNITDLSNRRRYRIDLSSFVRENDSVLVRFSDAQPSDGWGAWVTELRLEVDGKPTIRFQVGSPAEKAYLVADASSGLVGGSRFADGQAFWVYRFPARKGAQAILEVEMGNQFEVCASGQPWRGRAVVRVNPAHTRLPARFPVRTLSTLTVTVPPRGAEVLLKDEASGKPVVWRQSLGKGGVLVCALPPEMFASSPEGGELLRALVGLCVPFNESGNMVLKRADYTIVRCFERGVTLRGRYVNVLQPALPVVNNPSVPAGGWGLFKAIPDGLKSPAVLHATARMTHLQAGDSTTAFFIKAPSGTTAAVRLYTAGKTLAQVRAWGGEGNAVEVNVRSEGHYLLLNFPNHAEGVGIRVDWQP